MNKKITHRKSETMPASKNYLIPEKAVRNQFNVKNSRFIGSLFHVESEEEVQRYLDSVAAEFPDATHHAYAFRIGAGGDMIERASDDREPAGSAGPPMLQTLQGNKVSDVLIIGTRYFGGIKLGIGGLTRAYRECARVCLEKTALKIRVPAQSYRLTVSYEDFGAVNRLLECKNGLIYKADYGREINVVIEIPARLRRSFIDGFKTVTRGRGKWKKM